MSCIFAWLAIALRCACFTFSAVQHAACHINKPQVEAETVLAQGEAGTGEGSNQWTAEEIRMPMPMVEIG